MKKIAISILLSTAVFCSVWSAKKVRLHTLGDSTMEQQNPNVKDQRGWVQLLHAFFTEDLTIVDPAKSGTSSKTYYKQVYWARAKKAIQPGDYVLIQFGHNDEKHNGVDGDIGTAPTDSFRIYLMKFVNEVREMGANPILVTPVVRKMFERDGKLSRRGKHDLGEVVQQRMDASIDRKDTLKYNYPNNMKYVVKELKCPLIDMTQATARLVDSLGNNKATKLIYNLPGDGTHFGASGAMLFSQLFVRELQKQNLLKEYIRPMKRLITNPETINFANLFPGADAVQVFDIGYIEKNNNKNGGRITLTATDGFLLSTKRDSAYSRVMNLSTETGGITMYKLFVKTTPEKPGNITGVINVSDSYENDIINLSGSCQDMKDNQAVSVDYKLSNNAMPDVKGGVTALAEVWKGMILNDYNTPTSVEIKEKVQKNNIQGESWPQNEIDVVYSRYIQFGLKASLMSDLFIKSLGICVGGGSNFRVVASLTEDFSTSTTIGEAANVKTSEVVRYSFNTEQQVPAGKTMFIRIYPWGNKAVKNQNLSLYNLSIKGINKGAKK